MRNTLATLVVAAVVVLVIGTLGDEGWPGYLIGAINALTLWVIVLVGSSARRGVTGPGPATTYAVAAAFALAVGGVLVFVVGDGENAVWWSVGVILAGVLAPQASLPDGRTDRPQDRA